MKQVKKEELLKEIEETKKHLAELERKVKNEREYGWKPEPDKVYYSIRSTGQIIECSNWCEDTTDEQFAVGNVFKTKEDAEFELERRKVIHELRLHAHNFTTDELKDDDIEKYYIQYNCYNNLIECDYYTDYIETSILFESYEQAERTIKEVGEDRIKKYYFGIED